MRKPKFDTRVHDQWMSWSPLVSFETGKQLFNADNSNHPIVGQQRRTKKKNMHPPRNMGDFATRIVEQFPFDFTPLLSTLAKIRATMVQQMREFCNVYLHKLQENQGVRDICRRCISRDDKGGKYRRRKIRAREFRVHDRA